MKFTKGIGVRFNRLVIIVPMGHFKVGFAAAAEADRIRWLPSPLPCTGLKTTTSTNHERSKSQQY